MRHIQFLEGLPSIRGPTVFGPEAKKPLNELVKVSLASHAGEIPRLARDASGSGRNVLQF